ncbi:hypothetical protein CRENBAI_004895 [Crenichthys baileyi]|uniref:Uncharacterized protein n=1 Tax=Crenichthys baileyi TaxID=28760 RepID=A0AAV9QUV4_9TELE
MGDEVEMMEENEYLGVHLDNRLEWRYNCEAVYKKGQSRLEGISVLVLFDL